VHQFGVMTVFVRVCIDVAGGPSWSTGDGSMPGLTSTLP
jgi:hypothetical protein